MARFGRTHTGLNPPVTSLLVVPRRHFCFIYLFIFFFLGGGGEGRLLYVLFVAFVALPIIDNLFCDV